MTDKTIDELEAELAAASKIEQEAKERVHVLQTELQAAVLAKSDLLGHRVSFEITRGFQGKKFTKSFRVDNIIKRWSRKYEWASGRAILKDGTLGSARYDCRLSELTDHGPYVAPGETQ